MAYRLPGPANTFSISWESTLALVSAVRDPSKFKLPKYCEYKETKTRVFRYGKIDLDEPARILATNTTTGGSSDFAWAPGQAAPTGDNIAAFTFVDAATVKYAPAWILPDEAIDQGHWDFQALQMGVVQQKAITNRVLIAAAIAQTSSNWPASNTDTANNLNSGAGKWDTASSDPGDVKYQAIAKCLTVAATKILLQTNSVIKWADLNLVISPNMAVKMGNTSEVYDYTKGSPDAFERQVGAEKYMGEFNMPAKYKSISIVVEDAVKVTSKPNISTGLATSGTRAFAWADQTPVLLAKKGSTPSQFGGKAMATLELYHYRNMEVWTKNDTDNERQMGRVVDDVTVVLPYGQSGFAITNAL